MKKEDGKENEKVGRGLEKQKGGGKVGKKKSKQKEEDQKGEEDE